MRIRGISASGVEERRGHEAEPAFRRAIRQRCVGRRVAQLVDAARRVLLHGDAQETSRQ